MTPIELRCAGPLEHVARGARLHRREQVVLVRGRGEHHDPGRRARGRDVARRAESTAGHRDVQEHDVRQVLACQRDTAPAASSASPTTTMSPLAGERRRRRPRGTSGGRRRPRSGGRRSCAGRRGHARPLGVRGHRPPDADDRYGPAHRVARRTVRRAARPARGRPPGPGDRSRRGARCSGRGRGRSPVPRPRRRDGARPPSAWRPDGDRCPHHGAWRSTAAPGAPGRARYAPTAGTSVGTSSMSATTSAPVRRRWSAMARAATSSTVSRLQLRQPQAAGDGAHLPQGVLEGPLDDRLVRGRAACRRAGRSRHRGAAGPGTASGPGRRGGRRRCAAATAR